MKRNEQHYRKCKELEVELKQGKLTTDSFTPVDNLSYNTIQKGFFKYQDKLKAAEEAKDLEVENHKEALEALQDKLVCNHRIVKAKTEYSSRLKEDVDRCKHIVSTLKEQIKKPPHQLTKLSLEYLERDLKKYKYHLAILERRRTRRYRISRKERKPTEEQSDTEYSDDGYSTAEDLKDQEYFPHRYKLRRSAKRVPKPAHPRPQPSKETQPEEVVEITPVEPPPVVNPKTNPKPQQVQPVPDFRAVIMDQAKLFRDMVRRGEIDQVRADMGIEDDDDDQRKDHGRGRGQPRQSDRERSRDRDRSLRYSIRDIPTFDGKGDSMPHTHLIEFEDFLVNTGSEIHDLPQHGEPQEVDRPHYEAVVKDVVSKFKASLKGKPRLWFEMQYRTGDDEPKTVQVYKNMLSSFTTEYNPIGSRREQQIMAWKTLKWDPSKEKLDDFVYKFRRVAKELGYNADENLEVFNCCVPSHLYLYLKGATTIKEEMENIKRTCALGGVSEQATPAPTETKTIPVVPFMKMNDRQTLRTVSFKEDVVRENRTEINSSLEKLSQIIDKQLQLAEIKSRDNASKGRRRERRQ